MSWTHDTIQTIAEHISTRARKWIRVLHLLSAGLWIGGTAALTSVICLFHPQSPAELLAQNRILMTIDFFIIAPGALGCLASGILYARRTPYGFLRFRWIIAKWLVNIGFIVFGGLVVVPWLERGIARSLAIQDIPTETWSIIGMHLTVNTLQWATIILVVIISVFKPWGRTRFDL